MCVCVCVFGCVWVCFSVGVGVWVWVCLSVFLGMWLCLGCVWVWLYYFLDYSVGGCYFMQQLMLHVQVSTLQLAAV